MKLSKWIWQLAIWRDTRGQDMVEYALMAGFVTVAAAAAFPPVGNQLSTIFSKMISLTDKAGA